jgi:predicted metal-dependent peptidase
MTVIEKINKAKMDLVLNQPFYASLLFGLEFEKNTSIKTCCIDGKLIRYNPAFIDQLTRAELQGVLAHEIMHVAYCHHLRRGKRNSYKWNIAADYAINSLLLHDSFILPEGRLYDSQFDGMCAEEIYSLLGDMQVNANYQEDPGGCGSVEDAPEDVTETDVRHEVLQAGFIAQAQNKCPEYIKRILKDVLKPKIDWRAALSQFLSSISKNDYSWSLPNLRFLHYGLYLPALRSEEPGNVVIIIDTSGSIDDELIAQFSGEAQSILSTFKISLIVIYCDDLVRSVQILEIGEPVTLQPNGGGGTDFVPGFEYIQEHDLHPRAVVYLTDGYCDSFPDAPEFPVLWAIYSYRNFQPPFGEVIRVEN